MCVCAGNLKASTLIHTNSLAHTHSLTHTHSHAHTEWPCCQLSLSFFASAAFLAKDTGLSVPNGACAGGVLSLAAAAMEHQPHCPAAVWLA